MITPGTAAISKGTHHRQKLSPALSKPQPHCSQEKSDQILIEAQEVTSGTEAKQGPWAQTKTPTKKALSKEQKSAVTDLTSEKGKAQTHPNTETLTTSVTQLWEQKLPLGTVSGRTQFTSGYFLLSECKECTKNPYIQITWMNDSQIEAQAGKSCPGSPHRLRPRG